MLTVPGLPADWPGAVVHAAPDTAPQNDQICASQRAKPGGGDLRQNGGSRVPTVASGCDAVLQLLQSTTLLAEYLLRLGSLVLALDEYGSANSGRPRLCAPSLYESAERGRRIR